MGIFSSSNPVLDILTADHDKMKGLFTEFKQADDSRTKARLVTQALLELEVHATIEETLIYPAIRREIERDDLMDEALEEHHLARTLIKELKRMMPSDTRFDAKFSVLAESVKHHIKEEEGEMFPKAQQAEVAWDELQKEAGKRKEILLSRMAEKRSPPRRAASKRRAVRRRR